MRESGGIGPKAGLEIHIAAEECFEAAALASHPTGEILRSEMPRLSFSRRVPAGVVGVIAPVQLPAHPLDPLRRPGARAGQRGRS